MDRADFENFMREYQTAVYSFCRKLTYCRAQADDLFQQTFLAAFTKFGEIRGEGSPRAYLLALASGIWRNERRKYARRQRIATTVELESCELENLESGALPENEFMRREQNRLLLSAIHRLPHKLKIPLLLHYSGGLNVEEIAERCGCPAGTVKSRLFHARKKIKAMLEKEELFDERE